jgi:cell division protein FtsQ
MDGKEPPMPPIKKSAPPKRKPASPRVRAHARAQKGGKPSLFQEFKRTFLGLLVLLGLVVCAGMVYWVIRPNGFYDRVLKKVEMHLRLKGFTIGAIMVEGRHYTAADKVQAAIDHRPEEFPFITNPWQIKERLEKLPWVRSAIVQRRWPSTIQVRLIERYPIALWQNKGQYFLIDDQGHILENQNLKEFASLPVLTGEKAPLKAPALMDILNKFPIVLKHMTGATLVSSRRWDLILNDKLTIKLPEDEIQDELEYMSTLLQSGDLEGKNILSIDLRTPDRAYFYLKDDAVRRKVQQSDKR